MVSLFVHVARSLVRIGLRRLHACVRACVCVCVCVSVCVCGAVCAYVVGWWWRLLCGRRDRWTVEVWRATRPSVGGGMGRVGGTVTLWCGLAVCRCGVVVALW